MEDYKKNEYSRDDFEDWNIPTTKLFYCGKSCSLVEPNGVGNFLLKIAQKVAQHSNNINQRILRKKWHEELVKFRTNDAKYGIIML